jgi:hypothetical protein
MKGKCVSRLLAAASVVAFGFLIPSCKSSGAALASGCSINSDCDSPLVCAFGLCHSACKVSSDCPLMNPAEHCVVSGTVGVCELPQEVECSATQPCPNALLCASDEECRSPCETSNQCPSGQTCVAQPGLSFVAGACYETNGGGIADASGPDGYGGSSLDGTGGGPTDATSAAQPDTSTVTTVVGPGCAGASTFGPQAVSMSGGSYVSGVGTRTADGLLLFTAEGNQRNGDAGMFYAADVQGFDLSGNLQDAGSLPYVNFGSELVTLLAATTAPDGTTALFYDAVVDATYTSTHLDLLAPDLSVRISNQIEPTPSEPGDVQWAGDRFAVAWLYPNTTGTGVKVQMLGTDGSVYSGATLATDVPSGVVGSSSIVSIATSPSLGLIAVGYVSAANGSPIVQILDLMANAVGGPVSLAQVQTSAFAVGGTASGFVGLYDGQGDAGDVQQAVAITPSDAGAPIVSVSAPISLPGGAINIARASSDGTGAGFLVEYGDGVSFGYAPPGSPPALHLTPVAQAAGHDPINIASFGGRFGLFVYSNNEHAEYGVATGCPTGAGSEP